MTRVLLIEDDKAIVENLCAFLKGEDFLVTAVDGQTKALHKLEEETYEIVLLDVTLAEGMDIVPVRRSKQNMKFP